MDSTPPQEATPTLQLIDAWHAGDQEALSALVERFSDWIRAYVRKRMSPQVRRIEGSEDVIQTVLVKFLRTGPRFRPRSEREFKALLARAVTNRIIDLHDRSIVAGADGSQPAAVSQIGVGIASSDRPDRQSEVEEERAFVALALQLLSPEDRQVINLREWNALDYPAIAELLGIQPDAARMRFNNALVRLGRQVQRLKRGDTQDLLQDLD